MTPTPEQLIQTLSNKKYVLSDFNIIGIRNNTGRTDTFDDTMCLLYKDEFDPNGKLWALRTYDCTTDPGLYCLNNPENVHGTAILVPGQYKDSHRVGMHQGKYEALVQNSPVAVFRDSNKDSAYNMEPKSVDKGIFGINIHRANPAGRSTTVDKWSAGCQVMADSKDFAEFLGICKAHGKVFTYTLLEKKDIA